ncbi:alpha/beta fold hydrolase [Glaciecola sp. 1036]|uniref:alpha/beta fold hydrolase n=1 Tax=Alteromonadaceae TaxID=72275 RepID=UPI003D051812
MYSNFEILGKYTYKIFNALEAKSAKLTRKQISINGLPIDYYDNENIKSPALLLLHGFSADKNAWNRIAKYLTKDYRLIVPDLLGHGDTPYSPSTNYSAFTQAEMCQTLVKELKLQNICVIGNSMGGMIAMILHDKAPKEFTKAVLIDPAGAKTKFAIELDRLGANPFAHKDKSTVIKFYGLTMAKMPFIPKSVLSFIAKSQYIDKNQQLIHMFKDFFNINEFFELPFSNSPDDVLILWGKEDKMMPLENADFYQELTHQAPLIIYPGVGHMPMFEIPEKTANDIKNFLSKTK